MQERDTVARQRGSSFPKCHFFNSFFLNKLFKVRFGARCADHMPSLPELLRGLGLGCVCVRACVNKCVCTSHNCVHGCVLLYLFL